MLSTSSSLHLEEQEMVFKMVYTRVKPTIRANKGGSAVVWCVCALMRGVGDGGTIALSRGQTCERKLTGVATNFDTSAVGGTIVAFFSFAAYVYCTIPHFSWQQQLHQNLVWYHTYLARLYHIRS